MPTSIASGTITLADAAEHNFAAADTTNKIYALSVDLANMVNGDVVQIRIYTIVKSGGTERLAYDKTYANVQGEPIIYSVPVPAEYSFRATIQAVTAGQHAYDWNIMSVP